MSCWHMHRLVDIAEVNCDLASRGSRIASCKSILSGNLGAMDGRRPLGCHRYSPMYGDMRDKGAVRSAAGGGGRSCSFSTVTIQRVKFMAVVTALVRPMDEITCSKQQIGAAAM